MLPSSTKAYSLVRFSEGDRTWHSSAKRVAMPAIKVARLSPRFAFAWPDTQLYGWGEIAPGTVGTERVATPARAIVDILGG